MIQKSPMYGNLLVRPCDGKIVQADELYAQSHQGFRPVHRKRYKSGIIERLVKQRGIAGLEQNPFFAMPGSIRQYRWL